MGPPPRRQRSSPSRRRWLRNLRATTWPNAFVLRFPREDRNPRRECPGVTCKVVFTTPTRFTTARPSVPTVSDSRVERLATCPRPALSNPVGKTCKSLPKRRGLQRTASIAEAIAKAARSSVLRGVRPFKIWHDLCFCLSVCRSGAVTPGQSNVPSS